jgi:ribosomal protein S12 methylthiotransferase
MGVQEEISSARLLRKVGRRMTVLVDVIGEDEIIARSSADAPEIDGLVYFPNTGGIKIGQFVEVEIIGSDTHDLHAKLTPSRVIS